MKTIPKNLYIALSEFVAESMKTSSFVLASPYLVAGSALLLCDCREDAKSSDQMLGQNAHQLSLSPNAAYLASVASSGPLCRDLKIQANFTDGVVVSAKDGPYHRRRVRATCRLSGRH